jgi:hypothetical protein
MKIVLVIDVSAKYGFSHRCPFPKRGAKDIRGADHRSAGPSSRVRSDVV